MKNRINNHDMKSYTDNTCAQLERYMDSCGVCDTGKSLHRQELINNALQGDCQFVDRCPEWESCPMGEQLHRMRPGINPLFLRQDHIFDKPSDSTYRIAQ